MTGISHRPSEISPTEARVAVQALTSTGGNVSAAARDLGVNRTLEHLEAQVLEYALKQGC